MKIYVTKYALTTGIIEYEAEFNSTENIAIVINKTYQQFFRGNGKEFHLTKERAIQKAEEMRIQRIKSLEKQICKIKAINFKAGES